MQRDLCGCLFDGDVLLTWCGHRRDRMPPASRLQHPNPTDVGPPTDPHVDAPSERLTPSDCLPFLAAHPEVTTTRWRVIQALAYLEMEFGR